MPTLLHPHIRPEESVEHLFAFFLIINLMAVHSFKPYLDTRPTDLYRDEAITNMDLIRGCYGMSYFHRRLEHALRVIYLGYNPFLQICTRALLQILKSRPCSSPIAHLFLLWLYSSPVSTLSLKSVYCTSVS